VITIHKQLTLASFTVLKRVKLSTYQWRHLWTTIAFVISTYQFCCNHVQTGSRKTRSWMNLLSNTGQFHQQICEAFCACVNKMWTFFWRTNLANRKQHLANFSTQIWLKFCWLNWLTIFSPNSSKATFQMALKGWWNWTQNVFFQRLTAIDYFSDLRPMFTSRRIADKLKQIFWNWNLRKFIFL